MREGGGERRGVQHRVWRECERPQEGLLKVVVLITDLM